jgi:hypothetical protein
MPLRLGFIAPCLPTKAPQPPTGGAWLHEIKHDGFRVIARKDGERVGTAAAATTGACPAFDRPRQHNYEYPAWTTANLDCCVGLMGLGCLHC